MSKVFDLEADNSNLPDILDEFESAFADAEANIKLRGKNLEAANIEQASWLSYYDERRIELHDLVKHFELEADAVKGRLWVKFTETYNIALSATDKTQYINKEQAYLEAKRQLRCVEELYERATSIVEAFKARGYALKNITSLRVASLEDAML